MSVTLPPLRAWHRRVATRVSPVPLYKALYADQPYAFLYESLEAHGQRGRYSFIGADPRAILRARGRDVEITCGETVTRLAADPLDVLRTLIGQHDDAPPVAPFCGGGVGYLGYDVVRQIERLPDTTPDDLELPHVLFLIPREILCFDHLERVVHVILYHESGQAERFAAICAALAALQPSAAAAADSAHQAKRAAPGAQPSPDAPAPPLHSNMTPQAFRTMVSRAQEYIRAGDIFQVVLSQRFECDLPCPPLQLYEALRITNPSPYMYYLALGDLHIAGSSPEVLVGLTGRRVITRPLAGTRRRGATPEEDFALARELQADEKERAEHVMLVDLGRNDLGRVCEVGSVAVSNVLSVEHHSRVMHLVSSVEGWLREPCDAFDVFRAAFPAGTVSGAPKIRAMEIIEALEPLKRSVYAGAIGYFSALGDMDLCIAIRTFVIRGGKVYAQAGAGVVADSDPQKEYEETLNKAQALFRAVQLARGSAPS